MPDEKFINFNYFLRAASKEKAGCPGSPRQGWGFRDIR